LGCIYFKEHAIAQKFKLTCKSNLSHSPLSTTHNKLGNYPNSEAPGVFPACWPSGRDAWPSEEGGVCTAARGAAAGGTGPGPASTATWAARGEELPLQGYHFRPTVSAVCLVLFLPLLLAVLPTVSASSLVVFVGCLLLNLHCCLRFHSNNPKTHKKIL